MASYKPYETVNLIWRGAVIEVSYCPDFSEVYAAETGRKLGHLIVRVVEPKAAPLPFAPTGYLNEWHKRALFRSGAEAALAVEHWLLVCGNAVDRRADRNSRHRPTVH